MILKVESHAGQIPRMHTPSLRAHRRDPGLEPAGFAFSYSPKFEPLARKYIPGPGGVTAPRERTDLDDSGTDAQGPWGRDIRPGP